MSNQLNSYNYNVFMTELCISVPHFLIISKIISGHPGYESWTPTPYFESHWLKIPTFFMVA